MTHHTPESSQSSHNGLTKLGVPPAPDSGVANKALQPGTPILLQGCMCQEGDGVIVIKVNWRDKTYTGSLMDMEQHPWAAVKHIEISELGSPLEKELRFTQELKLNTKHNNGHESEEQEAKEDDVVMSPGSSEMVESEGGKSPDITSSMVLPRLKVCTDLIRTHPNAMDIDEKKGLFPSKSKQSLLPSPSTSMTDLTLRAESEKKKNHEHHHTGLSYPKEVIPSILGEDCVLPFDTSTKEKIKQEPDTIHDHKEEIHSGLKRPPNVLLHNKADLSNHKEGLMPLKQMTMVPNHINSETLKLLQSFQPLDIRHNPNFIHSLNKQMADKEQFQSLQESFIPKQETISPKSITPDSPCEPRQQQKKRRVENNDGNSPFPKRPESLNINAPNFQMPYTQLYSTEMLKSSRLDESSLVKQHHHPTISKTTSLPQTIISSSPSQPPKPHTLHERKHFTTSPDVIHKDPNQLTNSKLYDREKMEKQQGYHQVVPQLTPNRNEKVRMEKKAKRGREGGSPKDHNSEGHPKPSSFLPPSVDTKIPSYMNQIKTEATPTAYIPPEMVPSILGYPPQLYQIFPGMPAMATADQQKMLQQHVIIPEVKTEPEKLKPKSQSAQKAKPKLPLPPPPVTSYDYIPHAAIHPQLLSAIMVGGQAIPVVSKDGTTSLTTIPAGIPMMVNSVADKDKAKHQGFTHNAIHGMKPKIPTATTSMNSTRKLNDKSTNHEMLHEDIVQNHQMAGHDFFKQVVPPHLLTKHDINSHTQEQHPINMPQTYKQKNVVTTTSTNNNKMTIVAPNQLATLASLPQPPKMPNGGFVPPLFPLYMTPEIIQQMSIGNFPMPFDPSLYPLIDPTGAMRSYVQPQPDLDSKWDNIPTIMTRYGITAVDTRKNEQSKPFEGDPNVRVSCLLGEDGKLIENYYDDVKTLYEGFQRGVRLAGDLPCLGTRRFNKPFVFQTYAQIQERISNFGSGLIGRGHIAGQGTFIGIASRNCPEWVIVEQACNAYSQVLVPLYDTLGPEAIEHIVKQANTEVVVLSADRFVDRFRVVASTKVPKLVVKIGPVTMIDKTLASEFQVELVSMTELQEEGKKSPQSHKPPRRNYLATVCYTSGTTGKPKGAMLTHNNIISNLSAAHVIMAGLQTPITSEDSYLSYLPLAHMLEREMQAILYMSGARICFFQGDMKILADDILACRPTLFVSVPRLYNRLYDKTMSIVNSSIVKKKLFGIAMRKKQRDLERGIVSRSTIWDRLIFRRFQESLGGRVRVAITGAAPISSEVIIFLRCAFGCHVLEGYGQTEATAGVSITLVGEFVPGHVGPPLPCNIVKLVDVPDMEYYTKNGEGEVCCKGPNVFKGYLNDEAKTKEALDADGWLHSGDIGKWCTNGCLKIIDRKKHIVKLSNGEYIAPEKIENCYTRHPAIMQAFVHANSLYPFPVAILVPDPDTFPGWAEKKGVKRRSLEEMCSEREIVRILFREVEANAKEHGLNSFERIKFLRLVAEPFSIENDMLTPTFKLKRKELAKIFKEEIEDLLQTQTESAVAK